MLFLQVDKKICHDVLAHVGIWALSSVAKSNNIRQALYYVKCQVTTS